jgi:hypothetical protein
MTSEEIPQVRIVVMYFLGQGIGHGSFIQLYNLRKSTAINVLGFWQPAFKLFRHGGGFYAPLSRTTLPSSSAAGPSVIAAITSCAVPEQFDHRFLGTEAGALRQVAQVSTATSMSARSLICES